jgi:hypothetical protein
MEIVGPRFLLTILFLLTHYSLFCQAKALQPKCTIALQPEEPTTTMVRPIQFHGSVPHLPKRGVVSEARNLWEKRMHRVAVICPFSRIPIFV